MEESRQETSDIFLPLRYPPPSIQSGTKNANVIINTERKEMDVVSFCNFKC